MSNDPNQDQDSRQLLADLLTLSKLPSDKLQSLGDHLEKHAGFLSIERLAAEAFPEEAESVERMLTGLTPDSIEPLVAMVGQWRDSGASARELMTDERYASLKKNLPLLIRNSPAIARTRKASALQTVTGNELMGVMFVCDARPVYNKTHDDIDGYVPLATMKLVYQRQNADTEEIEFVMTPDEIDRLIERATHARDKIKVLNDKLNGCLPNAIVEGQP